MVSELGTGISGIAFTLLVLAATGSAAQAALVSACFSLALAVLSLPSGVVADRYSRRVILVATSAVELVAMGSVALAVLSGHVWLTQLAIVALIQGAMTALRSAAARPAFQRIVPKEQIDLALSRTLTGSGVVSLAAPPLGGTLFAWARWVPFAVDALSFGAAAVAAAMVRTPLGPTEQGPMTWRSLRSDLRAGFAYVWASGYLRFVAGWSCLLGSALSCIPLVIVVIARDHGAAPWLVGVTLTVGTVGGLLGSAASSWMIRRIPARRLVLAGSWALVAAMSATAFLTHPLHIAATIGVAYFLVSPLIVVINAYELRVVPDEYQGRVQSIMMMSELSLLWLILLAVGSIVDRFGAAAGALAITGLLLTAALLGNLTKALRTLDVPSDVNIDNR